MDDILFKLALEEHAEKLFNQYGKLFELNVDRDALWNLYLDSIPAEHNRMFRTRREYDCSACRHFVKNAGALAAIDQGKLISIWDVRSGDEDWDRVCEILSDYVKGFDICDVFVSDLRDAGIDHSMEHLESGEIIRWEHWHVRFPDRFMVPRGDTSSSIRGDVRTAKRLLERALEELSEDAISIVLELIDQNSLYRGAEHRATVAKFEEWKREYEALTDSVQKDLYVWEKAARNEYPAVVRIKNTSIGVLLDDISGGLRLDSAVKKYESVVAPANYKRSKTLFTQQMLEEAQKTITELGYMDSLSRRFANPDDITVNNILYRNADTAKRMEGGLFDLMREELKPSPAKFSKVEEIGIEDFISSVVPSAREIEAYVENRHLPNLCSLIAPVYRDSKPMFQWKNNFSWAYSGNVADSNLKQNVKKAGGNVEGVLRFSIQWNDLDGWDQNDMDAHCRTPYGEIYYVNKTIHGGTLDVDIIHPKKDVPAVENITWSRLSDLNGEYLFFVTKFSDRGGRSGFRAEIEFDGHIYSYDCREIYKEKQYKRVAKVTVRNGEFSIEHYMPTAESDKESWGIRTNSFVPVSVLCYSPNYWDEQTGRGNRHYLFMLKGCVNPETPNAWYNEFLNSDLYPKHRKVMEIMGMKARVQDTDDQLSGLGFSSTVRNDLVVRVKGATERIMKIRF